MGIRTQDTNPCIGLCQHGDDGLCIGCGRSREERFSWYHLPEAVQREILDRQTSEPLDLHHDGL